MAEKPIVLYGELDFTALLNAQKLFEVGLAEVNSELTRDGAIQRFEFTFELAWKTMKRV